MKVKTPEPKPSKSDNKRVQPRNRIKYTAGQVSNVLNICFVWFCNWFQKNANKYFNSEDPD